jgi:hypothetical protein
LQVPDSPLPRHAFDAMRQTVSGEKGKNHRLKNTEKMK